MTSMIPYCPRNIVTITPVNHEQKLFPSIGITRIPSHPTEIFSFISPKCSILVEIWFEIICMGGQSNSSSQCEDITAECPFAFSDLRLAFEHIPITLSIRSTSDWHSYVANIGYVPCYIWIVVHRIIRQTDTETHMVHR
jgi:hypothetical protein